MSRSEARTCWPSPAQENLLEVLICPDRERARSAWIRWRLDADFDALDRGSFRLLPRLYDRLRVLGVDDSMLGRLKGIWRRTWYENQLLSQKLAEVVGTLSEHGLETMLLKGMALSVAAYADLGQRPMADVDLLVPYADAGRALTHLRRRGLIPCEPRPESLVRVLHGVAMRDAGGFEVDLHWHLLKEACDDEVDRLVWERSAPAHIRGVATRVPSPTDLLFHAVAHGVQWNLEPPLRWVVDAAVVLEREPVDWLALCAFAETTGLALVVGRGLDYLRSRFALDVPERVPAGLLARDHGLLERLEYRLRVSREGRGLLGNLPRTLLHYRRLSAAQAPLERIAGFPRFLEDWWQLDGLGQLPGIVARKVIAQLLKATASDVRRRLRRSPRSAPRAGSRAASA